MVYMKRCRSVLLLLLQISSTVSILDYDSTLNFGMAAAAARSSSNVEDCFQDDSVISNPMHRYLHSSPLLAHCDDPNYHDNIESGRRLDLLYHLHKDTLRVRPQLPTHWWNNQNDRESINPLWSITSDDNNINNNNNNNNNSQYLAYKAKHLKKTGTTIAGICGRDFCVLGADTRATQGTLVADQRAQKLHWLGQSVVAAGAGTSADLQHICQQTAVTLALLERHAQVGNSDVLSSSSLSSSTDSPLSPTYLARRFPVHTVCRMLQDTLRQAGGAIQAYLIVGGVDDDTGRATLCTLHPHGSMDTAVAYTALGSGGYAAMGILESRYRPDITQSEAVQLVKEAIAAGIQNDLGSGSQIDLCIMSAAHGVQYLRSQPPPVLGGSNHKNSDTVTHTQFANAAGVNGFGRGDGSDSTTTTSSPIVLEHRRTLYDPSKRSEQKWQIFLDS